MMPFPGGIEATPNATLLFSVGAAILYLLTVDMGPTLARTAVKTLSILLLAVLAFTQDAPWLLVLALLLSAAGDAFLSRDGELPFMAGLVSFMAAHLAYIVLFLGNGEGLGLLAGEPWRAALALLLVLFAVAMLLALWRPVGSDLRPPVAIYMVALLAMALAALTMRLPLVLCGALLFMASDAMLAWEKFVARPQASYRPLMHRAVWITYYGAQMAIVLAFVLA